MKSSSKVSFICRFLPEVEAKEDQAEVQPPANASCLNQPALRSTPSPGAFGSLHKKDQDLL